MGCRKVGSGMSDDLKKRADELEFIPETFRYWLKRAQGDTPQAIAWRNYVLLMVTFGEAFSRCPMTEEACDALDILDHVSFEIDQLLASMYLLVGGRAKNALP